MKKTPQIIGLIGSARKTGNSEIVVKEVLRHCREQGADVAVLRLSDLTVKPCLGCYKCAPPSGKCPLNDSMEFFLDRLSESDGIVLGYPTYFHSIPGKMKMIQDRTYMINIKNAWNLPGKKGLVINVGTNRLGVALPMGELFLKYFNVDVISSAEFDQCSLPGSSLIKNHGMLKTLKQMAMRLMAAVSGEDTSRPDTNCPFCRRRIVKLLENSRVECPVCKRGGHIVAGQEIRWENQNYFFDIKFLFDYYRSLFSTEKKEFIHNRPLYFDLLSQYKDKKMKIEWLGAGNACVKQTSGNVKAPIQGE